MSRYRDYTGKAPIYQQWDDKAFEYDTKPMHWLARALYRTLLQAAFHLSSRPDLPADDQQLINLLGVPKEVWDDHKAAVRAMFTFDAAAGILWQKRLRNDWQDLSLYRLQQKKRVEARWAAAKEKKTQPVDTTVLPANYHGNTSRAKQSSKTEEIESPLPPEGVPPPPPPAGERSDAAGLSNQTPLATLAAGNERPMSPAQRESLNKSALLYADFSAQLYGFSPNINHVTEILRNFEPLELLFAQINRFPPDADRLNKQNMTYFFAKSARDTIQAARIKGIATADPDYVKSMSRPTRTYDERKRFFESFQPVVDAWREVFPATSEANQIENATEQS